MPLVCAHTTLMLPEALVVESMLHAHGIRVAVASQDIISQCPHMAVVFGGITLWVEEGDLDAARELIGEGEEVPGYKSIESDSFEEHPVRNAVLGFLMLIMGLPFPFWYRNAGPLSSER